MGKLRDILTSTEHLPHLLNCNNVVYVKQEAEPMLQPDTKSLSTESQMYSETCSIT
jgi:hypothetical protein